MIAGLLWKRRLDGLAVLVVVLVAVAVLPASGCSKETVTGECIGGQFDANGRCVAPCDPSKCKDGNVCAEGACRLECTGHFDCVDESQACEEATSDQGLPVQVCRDTGRGRANVYLGIGMPCPTGGECTDVWTCDGNRACNHVADPTCVEPACRPVQYCPNGLQCDFYSCGGDPTKCVKTCEGENCNLGQCSDTQAPCTFNTCAQPECKPMRCLRPSGSTVTPGVPGEGDADAYCSFADCADDAACGPGFYCGRVREAAEICGFDVDADALVGAGCGTAPMSTPCVDPGSFTANASTYFEGPVCLMRNACRLRDECAPCETHLDCSKGLGDVCVPLADQNVCARWCSGDGDCDPDEACTFSGQDALGFVCLPRTGSCRATTATTDKFCHRCLDDADCGDASGAWSCRTTEGGAGCLQLDLPITCTTDNDCPIAPSGAHGHCLDEDPAGVMPTDPAYHRCFLPLFSTTGFSCWP